MLIEMWAYVCDVLSFYDETIAHESYLRTARRDPSVRMLVGLLGYRPRPAVAAQVRLAVKAGGRLAIVLPAGLAVRSSAFGTEKPQVFELDAEARAHPLLNGWRLAPDPPGPGPQGRAPAVARHRDRQGADRRSPAADRRRPDGRAVFTALDVVKVTGDDRHDTCGSRSTGHCRCRDDRRITPAALECQHPAVDERVRSVPPRRRRHIAPPVERRPTDQGWQLADRRHGDDQDRVQGRHGQPEHPQDRVRLDVHPGPPSSPTTVTTPDVRAPVTTATSRRRGRLALGTERRRGHRRVRPAGCRRAHGRARRAASRPTPSSCSLPPIEKPPVGTQPGPVPGGRRRRDRHRSSPAASTSSPAR